MTSSILIGDKNYVLCDFKSPTVSLQQGLKLSELVHAIVQIPSLHETLVGIIQILMSGSTRIPTSAIISAILNAKDLFKREELPQIFFLCYLPEGEVYNEEYENTLAARAQQYKYQVPLNALIEGLTSFFTSRTTAKENSVGGSPEEALRPQTT